MYANAEKRLFYKNEVKMALTPRPELVDCTADLGTIVGIQNPAGEIVELQKPIFISTCIEKTLLYVEQEMSFAVSATFIECQYSFTTESFWDWIRLWPT